MALVSIPTSADIYIEVNGTKVAAAQSYRVKSSRQSRYVEAFGSSEPVGTVGGRVRTGSSCPASACAGRKGWTFMS